MERLKHMMMFAKVVEFGSFTRAASQLRISVPAISRTVSKLEQDLQVKLLNRNTRSIGLTEAGKIYYQGCCKMLYEVHAVHDQLYAFNNTPSGVLRIGCSCAMAQNLLAEMTVQMLRAYPKLDIHLVTGTTVPDVITQGLDIVIHSGTLRDSGLFSSRLGSIPMVICATKSYLAQHGTPQHPAQLHQHHWLEYNLSGENLFELTHAGGETVQFIPHGRFITNDLMALIHWLLAGTGISCVPQAWVANAIAGGSLDILLPDYQVKPRPVYALYTKKNQLPLKVQVCIDHLLAHFAGVTPAQTP